MAETVQWRRRVIDLRTGLVVVVFAGALLALLALAPAARASLTPVEPEAPVRERAIVAPEYIAPVRALPFGRSDAALALAGSVLLGVTALAMARMRRPLADVPRTRWSAPPVETRRTVPVPSLATSVPVSVTG